jgi:energy-coupling factor transporter transmembrane protein EcfT
VVGFACLNIYYCVSGFFFIYIFFKIEKASGDESKNIFYILMSLLCFELFINIFILRT